MIATAVLEIILFDSILRLDQMYISSGNAYERNKILKSIVLVNLIFLVQVLFNLKLYGQCAKCPKILLLIDWAIIYIYIIDVHNVHALTRALT